MGKEIILSQFDDIEDKVRFLIGFCSALKDENAELKNQVTELEKLKKLDDEHREVVKGKVDGLLYKLKSVSDITS